MTFYPRYASGPAGHRSRFTLLELLVVIAVITILVGIVIGGFGIANRKAAEAKTRALLTQLEIAFDQYKQQFGYFPQWPRVSSEPQPIVYMFVMGRKVSTTTPHTRYHGLEQPNPPDPSDPNKAADPGRYYLDASALTFTSTADDGQLKDAFDNSVYYQCPGEMNPEGYDLWTSGADVDFGDPASADKAKSSNSQKSDAATTNSNDITNWKRN